MLQGINALTAQVTTLMQALATLTGATGAITGHTHPINIVEKPKAFEGKTSEAACLFHSFFTVWVHDHDAAFAPRDLTTNAIITDANGNTVYNSKKMISSALSFMTGNATVWARSHLKKITDRKDIFVVTDDQGNIMYKNHWEEFLYLFKAKFEPQDAITEAKNMKQGNRTFSDYLADFETWAPRTG